jgi:hypothetical protein
METQKLLNQESLSWLLEPKNPGVRYLALRDLVEISSHDPDLLDAKETAHRQGPIAAVLDNMEPAGYWVRPGHGYNPKYRSTVWSLILLAQLGASADQDERIATACEYLLEHGLSENGQFTTSGSPSGTVDCLQGNLCNALLDLGIDDPRLDQAFEWMARSQTGEGIAPLEDKNAPLRYYAYKCGPGFACGVNASKPCAWGAVKVMLAFSKLPEEKRTPLIERAIKTGIDFLFSVDPVSADYPTRLDSKPNRSWWKFGFPVFYVTDILQNVEALVRLGYGKDPRLANALNLVKEKQDANGHWSLEYDYQGKTWLDFGEKKQPNKWVTLRAVWVLKNASGNGKTAAQ